MTENRLDRGLAALKQIDGRAGQDVMTNLADVAPDVGRYILEFAFGDIYTRSGLDLKQRELVTLASLLTQGDTAAQLNVHIQGALNVGLSQAEIIETFIHCIPYVGFPRVLNAVAVAKQIFTK